jgi:hypothetical protein
LHNALTAILAIDANLHAAYTATQIKGFLNEILAMQWSGNDQLNYLWDHCLGYTPKWSSTSLGKEFYPVYEMAKEEYVRANPDDQRIDRVDMEQFQPPPGYEIDDTQWSLSYGSLHFDSAFSALPPTEFPTIFSATF